MWHDWESPQQATVSALMNAGLDLRTARAAAVNPEYLRALVVAHYETRRGQAGAAPRTGTDAAERQEAARAGDVGGKDAPQAIAPVDVGKAGR